MRKGRHPCCESLQTGSHLSARFSCPSSISSLPTPREKKRIREGRKETPPSLWVRGERRSSNRESRDKSSTFISAKFQADVIQSIHDVSTSSDVSNGIVTPKNSAAFFSNPSHSLSLSPSPSLSLILSHPQEASNERVFQSLPRGAGAPQDRQQHRRADRPYPTPPPLPCIAPVSL